MSNYLYNGVRLPKLPHDSTVCPYAVLHHVEAHHYEIFGEVKDEPEMYVLNAISTPYYAHDTVNGIRLGCDGDSDYQQWRCCAPDFSVWELHGEGHGIATSFKKPMWTSADIYYGEYDNATNDVVFTDELYMSASPAPIPVLPLDPTALLMGWLAGKRVAAMRGNS